ncbi:MAG TPA: glycosyltransferase [Gemmatimonadaceae bacterium]|nr:glycosyltransferase [Gemmatimonadaceae bacterium]
MRLAVFTNRFPGFVNTFFARDVRTWIEAGITVDVFAIYPVEPELWRYVPSILDEHILPRERVHHLSARQMLRFASPHPAGPFGRLVRDTGAVGAASARYGAGTIARSLYVSAQAWAWARRFPAGSYDHVLAYWGNYSATCAYLYQRLTDPRLPFSMFVQARMDLYRKPAYLSQKMLYADNIFLVCEFNRRYIRQHYPEIFNRIAPRIRVHHLGLDLDSFRYEPGGRRSGTVIAVGRLERLKGFHNLVRAIHLLVSKGMDVTLEIVGDGEELAPLRALAAQLGIADRVRFLGWLRSDDVKAAMQRATLLAHPPIELDAMPTVLKEAMALGTPVVASALAGAPEILDDGRCGILVPAGDVQALTHAVERLLRDDALRARLAAAGRRHVERTFDLWENGRRLAELLRASRRQDGAQEPV